MTLSQGVKLAASLRGDPAVARRPVAHFAADLTLDELEPVDDDIQLAMTAASSD